ncbi:MAG: hypothetical protein JWQ57_5150 [Mucilaginibacter sp.]|nr:hypothetical protein [Mucilaginibacter sp.]
MSLRSVAIACSKERICTVRNCFVPRNDVLKRLLFYVLREAHKMTLSYFFLSEII